MNKEELITALGELGYPLFTPRKGGLGSKKVIDVLDKLSGSEDPRLIEAFPVVLANCAHRGIKLDLHGLLSRYAQRRFTVKDRAGVLLACSEEEA
jgi:hypothetical protein